MNLGSLGNKICIIGCAASGKSTLSQRLAHKLQIPAYHLDKLAHLPSSKWVRVSDEELITQHNLILSQPN